MRKLNQDTFILNYLERIFMFKRGFQKKNFDFVTKSGITVLGPGRGSVRLAQIAKVRHKIRSNIKTRLT